MKKFLIIIAIFFVGCSTKYERYILPKGIAKVVATTNKQIGVKSVKIPSYLEDEKILIKKENKISAIDAKFATTPSELFTQKLISSLKSALNDPNVFLYPWDVDKKRGVIVEVVLDDFLYEDSQVKLKGSYYIKDANNKVLVAKNFAYFKPSKEDANSIVYNLSELFNNLTKEIAIKIAG
jgi:uncharacterized lipoprotein YmbA